MEMYKDFEISEFQISDYSNAVALWETIEGVTLNESDTVEAISLFLQRNPNFSFIAKWKSGETIGTILCGHNGRAGQIYHLAVSKSHRGKGLGKKLVSLCFSKLAQENIPRCNIFVYSNNQVGNSFWLNTGWHDPTTWKVLQKHVQA